MVGVDVECSGMLHPLILHPPRRFVLLLLLGIRSCLCLCCISLILCIRAERRLFPFRRRAFIISDIGFIQSSNSLFPKPPPGLCLRSRKAGAIALLVILFHLCE